MPSGRRRGRFPASSILCSFVQESKIEPGLARYASGPSTRLKKFSESIRPRMCVFFAQNHCSLFFCLVFPSLQFSATALLSHVRVVKCRGLSKGSKMHPGVARLELSTKPSVRRSSPCISAFRRNFPCGDYLPSQNQITNRGTADFRTRLLYVYASYIHSSVLFPSSQVKHSAIRDVMCSKTPSNLSSLFSFCAPFVTQVGWSPLHYAVLGGHVAAVEALLRAGAYPCFRDNHLISPLHLASTQAGEKETFRRIAELLGPSALLARDEVHTHDTAISLPYLASFVSFFARYTRVSVTWRCDVRSMYSTPVLRSRWSQRSLWVKRWHSYTHDTSTVQVFVCLSSSC